MKCITGKYGWLLAISCWLLAVSCSSDGTGEQRHDNVLQIVPYTTVYQNSDAMSRRVDSPGYSPYNPDHDLSIGLYVLPETPPTVKLIRYSNGVWHSQVTVEGGHSYTIYGFMPKRDAISSTISQGSGNVTLTLSGIPAVIADDVCFITGVNNLTGDLLQGKFDYAGQTDNNKVRLLFDHLFAAVKFNFTVDEEYSKLRTIKLKKMELTSTATSVNATITLTPNTTGADPVSSVSYTPTGSSSTAMFFESATGIELTSATISNSFCCFAPGLGNNLTLISTYDVYDKKGNKIAERTTPNKLPNLDAIRGQSVTINLNVAPTYLGVLSDPDLDNPTFTVN